MPLTTSTSMPARAQGVELLAAASEHERIAALQPHDDAPARASRIISCSMNACGVEGQPPRLPTATMRAPGRACASTPRSTSSSCRITSARASARTALTVSSSGIARDPRRRAPRGPRACRTARGSPCRASCRLPARAASRLSSGRHEPHCVPHLSVRLQRSSAAPAGGPALPASRATIRARRHRSSCRRCGRARPPPGGVADATSRRAPSAPTSRTGEQPVAQPRLAGHVARRGAPRRGARVDAHAAAPAARADRRSAARARRRDRTARRSRRRVAASIGACRRAHEAARRPRAPPIGTTLA